MPNDRGQDASTAGPAEPLMEAGAPFAEPWQARAFALAVLACRRGCFTWSEWTRALGRELQAVPQRRYFDCWLAALQSLLAGKDLIGAQELGERQSAWEAAYRRTPHGKPVSLIER
jgi:nitrile hydratase accessory protein